MTEAKEAIPATVAPVVAYTAHPSRDDILRIARVRMGDGPLTRREDQDRQRIARGWCPLYLMPAGTWFRREDHRGYGWPPDVRLCRVLEPWGGKYFPYDLMLVDSWDEDGTMRRVAEPWMVFSGSRVVIDPPAWWVA